MKKVRTFLLLLLLPLLLVPFSSADSEGDVSAMLSLKKSLNPPSSFGWSDPDPCKWTHVVCTSSKRVTRIQIGHSGLQGTLSSALNALSELERLELQWNNISGPVPSLTGLSSLQVLMLSNNNFESMPSDVFQGLSSLQSVEIDNNPFESWQIPESLRNASSALQNFSANSANLTGFLPGFLGPDEFPGLSILHLAFNGLVGELPLGFSGSQIQSLWLNGQKLTGSIDVLQNMTGLREVWLHSNSFSGPLPDFSGLKELESLSLRDNSFTGPVPESLMSLESLKVLNLTNNHLQGSVPEFKSSVSVDLDKDSNSFCLPSYGECDPRVRSLLLIVGSMDYPLRLAESWKGNDPCTNWIGITCSNGNITVINLEKMGLTGTISPEFGSIKSLQRIVLGGNNLTGTIPRELTLLPNLKTLDVSSNHLFGKVPSFRSNVIVNTKDNPDMGKDKSSLSPPGSSSLPPGSSGSEIESNKDSRKVKSSAFVGIIVGSVLGGLFSIFLIGLLVFCWYNKRQKRFTRGESSNAVVVHPRHSGSDNESVKITVAGSSVSVGGITETYTLPGTSEAGDNIQMVEAGNMLISIQVLRSVTNNFSQDNILGQGGFGVVYKGELHDGTKIAVKRMENGVIAGKGFAEFKSEIAVLTKVRHRHLVTLLGYCLDGNEKLLVYEYMPQGTLSRHLFEWSEEGLKPLLWKQRLTLALDVARGVEYLHSLAHQSFIHRDLKPSNILLGDDMRAKVADFGLVRLAPEGKGSIETRIAGTFGYLAPEYAVTGRVTTKVDVYSFGVILMEIITGRKSLDESQPEESIHLVSWFKRMYINKESSFKKAIDPTIDLDEETLASVHTVAELAGHCCAREPYQRPDMGHAVNILSSLVELWKPSDQNPEDIYGIDLDMSLPQALKKWQAYEGRSDVESSSSSLLPSLDNTQMSIPTRPYGFAESFTSVDGR
ncbi:unnamed protein product [Cochlearia groenlandica]